MGHWLCPKCDCVNYRRREACFKCTEPMPPDALKEADEARARAAAERAQEETGELVEGRRRRRKGPATADGEDGLDAGAGAAHVNPEETGRPRNRRNRGGATTPASQATAHTRGMDISTKAVASPTVARTILPLTTPLYLTSTYQLHDVDHGATLQEGREVARHQCPYVYSRWGNPTVDAAAAILADLEAAQFCRLFPSGMSAICTTLLSLLQSGDHIVAQSPVYGGTHEVLTDVLTRLGIESTFVDNTIESFRKAKRPNTKLFYGESPTNPTMSLLDMVAFGKLGKELGVTTVVDATFATPLNVQGLKCGVDVIVHSGTKYLGGHSDIVIGAVVTNSQKVSDQLAHTQKILGSVPSPFDAFLLARGLKTLPVRMERINATALQVALFLEGHPAVSRVHYPGLKSHPAHDLATRQMAGYGGMISFEVAGGLEAGRIILESVRLIHLAVSLGGVESLIEHPALMTHTMVPKEQRQQWGITDDLIRLSIGLESARDIIRDLKQALAKVSRTPKAPAESGDAPRPARQRRRRGRQAADADANGDAPAAPAADGEPAAPAEHAEPAEPAE
eukprot:NODE_195_length_1841_cov_114.673549_g146_i0.p1 GENE.NODE_195_length_1841_cov_114.673549_g146_i0~~NODE_195_length_1841_cov_114.673549_g146_i0.p1  ORF type:complete len:574 (-),score=182.68 NODE_195_length_1841_cov_114.673549_g146_i0:118-1815(-)